MDEQERHNLFSELVTRHHHQLYGFIFAIVRNREDAGDLFQSVCLILWRKFDSFRPGSSFLAWACQTAKHVVRSFLRHKKRQMSCVDEDLLEALAGTDVESENQNPERYLAALKRCRGKLDAADEELLELRYSEDMGSRDIADRLRRPQQSVCRSLTRIRHVLLECIELELSREDRSMGGLL